MLSQETVIQMISDLMLGHPEFSGPPGGPWRSDDGLRIISYWEGHLTMWSMMGDTVVETTRVFVPHRPEDVIELWIACMQDHIIELDRVLVTMESIGKIPKRQPN